MQIGHQDYCQYCKANLRLKIIDLGELAVANNYLSSKEDCAQEQKYPLYVNLCERCFLVQLGYIVDPKEIFNNYAYYSSFSGSWLQHCENYVTNIMAHKNLTTSSFVMEVGSNDGYLLQYFLNYDIPVLGVEPSYTVANAAIKKNIPTKISFFNKNFAESYINKIDLLIANNVFAHIPDIDDFITSMNLVLKADGIITIEFPHILNLIKFNQFDTIYHEHYYYFSVLSLQKIFAAYNLILFKIEQLDSHGGSLRIYLSKTATVEASVQQIIDLEVANDLDKPNAYMQLTKQAHLIKDNLLKLLEQLKINNKTVVGYGAPAKGNTLLDFCNINSDLLTYTVDKNPQKQGNFLPGSHLPIHHVNKLSETKPDYILILPWNIQQEIIKDLSLINTWGAKFIVAIPEVKIL